MKQAILDTSFILSCIRNKIDFFEDLKFLGIKILIPSQVIKEIKQIINSKKKLKFKEDAVLALKLLEKNKFKEINLSSKEVDKGIIKLANKENYLVATLDREIKDKVKTQKIIIRAKKKLEII